MRRNVNPELAKAARKAFSFPYHKRWGLVSMRLAFRLGLMNSGNGSGVKVRDIKLKHSRIRLYEPLVEASGVGVLFIHGGGLILGSNKQNGALCGQYATELGATVASVEYRLAPEHKYPAASDDCLEAWQWFQDNAKTLNVDPKRIAVAGQSAGGGLAAQLCQRVHDIGGVQPAAQFLWYPMLDDRTAGMVELDKLKHLNWNNVNNRFGWSSYLGCDAGSPDVPKEAVPSRRDNLENLPPAWIGIGSIDLFYNESKEYGERLKESGVEVEMEVVQGGFHGFEVMDPNANPSQNFVKSHFDFARKQLL